MLPGENLPKVPIAIMIGGGSKLPPIIKTALNSDSKFYISLVVSHKSSSPGVEYALSHKIPAIYFKLPDYRKRIFAGKKKARADYMRHLGWFISQKEYKPKLLVFAGWDLIMDKNFFDFFKANIGDGYAAINLHPAILPKKGEKQKIRLPDGTYTPTIKGQQEEVLKTVMAEKLTYFGPTVHFMVPSQYDTGQVIEREFIKVGKSQDIKSLRKKLMPIEDKILISSITKVINKYLL